MTRASLLLGILLTLTTSSVTAIARSDFEQLITELDTLRAGHGVAGYALTVITSDGEQLTAFGGLADRASGRAVDPDTLFRIGSITKTFNALAVSMLVERGLLELEDPLRALVPDAPLENPWADDYPVRVAHLLEHSSGLLDITREEFDHNSPFPSLEAAFAFRPEARVVHWPPGRHSVYSNANAGYLGLVIERTSEQDYERFITDELLLPLGMLSASLLDDPSTRQRLATGYDTDGVTPIPYWHMIFPPLGAINAAPQEMGGLIELFLNRGVVGDERLLESASIDRMESAATTLAARHGLSYGYGLGLDQSLRQGFIWYGHTGDGDGYLSHLAYNHRAGAGYFLTINAFNHRALDAMKTLVQYHLAAGVAPLSPPPVADVEAHRLRSLTGTYTAITRRFEWQDPTELVEDRLEVVFEDGALHTRSEHGQRRLVPVTEHLFRREGQPIATIAIAAEDGEIYLQGDFGNYRRLK